MTTKITDTKAELAARVASFQKIDVKHGASILVLAAASMVFASDLGGNKDALKEMRTVISGVSSEYGRQVSAWVGGNLDKYAAYIQGSHDATPADRTKGLVSLMVGEPDAKGNVRGWRKIRSEHIAPKGKKTDKVEGGEAGDGANGSTEAETETIATPAELLAVAVKAVKAITSMADLNALSLAVLNRINSLGKAERKAAAEAETMRAEAIAKARSEGGELKAALVS